MLCCPTLRCPTLRCPTLRCPTLRCPTLRCPTLRCPTRPAFRRSIVAAFAALVIAFVVIAPPLASGQEVYEAFVPGAAIQSMISVGPAELIVISDGQTTRYARAPSYDSPEDVGFFNRAERQVIRWPRRNAARFLIGDVSPFDGSVTFRLSQMRVKLRGPAGPSPSGNPIPGAPAQSATFLLRSPSGAATPVTLSARLLQMSVAGVVRQYQRDPRYDALGYTAYANLGLPAQQVIRWPVDVRNPMVIGDVTPQGMQFRNAVMQIQAGGGVPIPFPTPGSPPPRPPGPSFEPVRPAAPWQAGQVVRSVRVGKRRDVSIECFVSRQLLRTSVVTVRNQFAAGPITLILYDYSDEQRGAEPAEFARVEVPNGASFDFRLPRTGQVAIAVAPPGTAYERRPTQQQLLTHYRTAAVVDRQTYHQLSFGDLALSADAGPPRNFLLVKVEEPRP